MKILNVLFNVFVSFLLWYGSVYNDSFCYNVFKLIILFEIFLATIMIFISNEHFKEYINKYFKNGFDYYSYFNIIIDVVIIILLAGFNHVIFALIYGIVKFFYYSRIVAFVRKYENN